MINENLMKKMINWILITLMYFGCVSCTESKNSFDLKLSDTNIEITRNQSVDVTIDSGNGEYQLTVNDPRVVKAVRSGNIITITGIEAGSTTITVTDNGDKSAVITVRVTHDVSAANIITFDVSATADKKEGNIGFLHSIHTDAPVDSFVTLIKPKLWRVGVYNDPFNLYHRLVDLGVERQLLSISGFRREGPFRDVFDQHGFGAMSEALLAHVKDLGLEYEFDIYNEPNHIADFDMESFMRDFWNPTYRAIREIFPEAKIHGPSHGINNSGNPKKDSTFVFEFIDAAIRDNTLPDYINWHLQVGYEMTNWHMNYAQIIEEYINSKGHSILGCVIGETIRPGSERNTSPGVLIDMFLSAEVGKIPQIRAAWSSSLIYGVSTSRVPVLCGILTGEDGKGRRGAWWTYRFFAETEGYRIECKEGLTGSENLVGISYRDDEKQVIRSLVGIRDTKKEQNALLVFDNLNSTPYISENGKVHLKMWYNYQTENNVESFGSEYLPLIMDTEVEIVNNKIEIPVRIYEWDAVLVELSKP